jgi:N,N'-diacetyllegionaminate synthase
VINKKFIIAEIGQAHEGSLGIAHSYIDALAETGIDAVKFQTHIASAESSSKEQFRVNFSFEDLTRFDYWKRMEFGYKEWVELKKHCEDKGMEFISSPFSCKAVDLLEDLGVKRYKIGSGELQNFLMLEKIARTGKPMILSSGMSDWHELEETVSFLKPFGNELSVMQCTTAYPTVAGQWSLHTILEMKNRFGLPIGFSDHSGKVYVGIAAAAMGAELLEVHAVFDRRIFGPDSKASLTIDEINHLVQAVRDLEIDSSIGETKEDVRQYLNLKIQFGKSLAVNTYLQVGHIISFKDLESKKPGDQGIPAKNYKSVLGRQLRVDKKEWDFLKEEDLS